MLIIRYLCRAAFYIGCVIEGLDYLHSRGILYRYFFVIVVVCCPLFVVLIVCYLLFFVQWQCIQNQSNQFNLRDLKPENCLLASNGYLKLVDLGLAKRLKVTLSFWDTVHRSALSPSSIYQSTYLSSPQSIHLPVHLSIHPS